MKKILVGTQAKQVKLLYEMIDREKEVIRQAKMKIARLEDRLLKIGRR